MNDVFEIQFGSTLWPHGQESTNGTQKHESRNAKPTEITQNKRKQGKVCEETKKRASQIQRVELG